MRISKSIVFDEKKEAEHLLKNGSPKIDYGKMYIIAKYIKDKSDYGAIRLERELIRYCKEKDKNFNPVLEASTIKKWVKIALLYKLRDTSSVILTEKEVSFLKTIKEYKDKKILYAILLISKVLKKSDQSRKPKEKKHSDKHYIWYSNFTDIIKLSQVSSLTETKLADFIFKYKNLFSFYTPEKQCIEVLFAENSQQGIIIELEKAKEEFEHLFEKTSVCSNCGEVFYKKSNNQPLCPVCSKEKRNNSQKLLMRKIRKSDNVSK